MLIYNNTCSAATGSHEGEIMSKFSVCGVMAATFALGANAFQAYEFESHQTEIFFGTLA